jgi:hypothetical protein
LIFEAIAACDSCGAAKAGPELHAIKASMTIESWRVSIRGLPF